MKISVSMNDDDFNRIEKYIDCRDWANPMQDEFVFYDPDPKFLMMLALFDIPFYKDE